MEELIKLADSYREKNMTEYKYYRYIINFLKEKYNYDYEKEREIKGEN